MKYYRKRLYKNVYFKFYLNYSEIILSMALVLCSLFINSMIIKGFLLGIAFILLYKLTKIEFLDWNKAHIEDDSNI